MILAFFDNKGLVYSHIVARGVPINANYIVKVLGLFMKQLKKKRPVMVAQQWWLHWDNAQVHTTAVVQEWLAAHNVQVIRHPPYSPDLAPADFFLFWRVKEQLVGLTLDQNTIKKTWEGVTRAIAPEEFATAEGGGVRADKSAVRSAATMCEKLRNKCFLNLNRFLLIHAVRFGLERTSYNMFSAVSLALGSG
jgi:hypothetical protein